MTPQQIQDVTRTWAMIAPTADAAVALFYERLFAIDPALRAFFAGTDLPAQRRKLAAALATVLGGLDRLDALLPALADLGCRHARLGVADRHYDRVGEALLWTLEQGLGAAWTDDVHAAWVAAYGLVADAMRTGDDARLAA
jgi:hemoglobin-like flavoprotein